MNRLRLSEHVPPLPARDAHPLRGLPPSWEQSVVESGIDALVKRARALASVLSRSGHERAATDLGRRTALLERVDELHRHAADLEALTGIYAALAALAGEHDPSIEGSVAWLQAGVASGAPSTCHGPAFRETARLRNRAFRSVAAAVAAHARGTHGQPGHGSSREG